MELTSPQEFIGVFYFTNWTKDEFIVLWNNTEYTFPPEKTIPLIIPSETLENIQEIRKKFAYKLAEREWYSGKEYTRLSKMGNGLPPTFDPKVLEPLIQRALEPLPIAKATTKKGKVDSDKNYKGSKAIGEKDNPNYVFREEADNAKALGAMPGDRVVS